MSKTETCALCHEVKPLCKSHLLPKSLYKLIRREGAHNPNPWALTQATKSSAAFTSRQAVEYLLCTTCENVLSAEGEKYVLAHCLRQDGTFPLRELTLAIEPVTWADGQQLYHGTRNPALNTDALRHFAVGVFWKASVTAWHTPVGHVSVRNPLGSIYEESFRQYLIGRSPFPNSARLMIWLCAESDPPVIVVFPDTKRCHGYHAHRFFVPGLCFHMLVGRVLPPDVPPIWGPDTLEIPILVHTSRHDGVHTDVFDLVSIDSKKLLRKLVRSTP